DSVIVGLQTPHARPGLDDRSEHIEQQCGALTLRLVICGLGFVEQTRGIEDESESALDIALRRQQHAPDIGVLDDRDRRTISSLGAVGPTLTPVASITEGIEVPVVAEPPCTGAAPAACLSHPVVYASQHLDPLTQEVA